MQTTGKISKWEEAKDELVLVTAEIWASFLPVSTSGRDRFD